MKLKPAEIQGVPLRYEPVNELGVVFLFSAIAKKLRLRVDMIQSAFPDCIAYQNTGKGERKIRIEFEHKAKNFLLHKHDPKKCDWVVCWENNWPSPPKNLKIIELRSEFGLGFNVWIMPVSSPYKETLSEINSSTRWSVPSLAHKNDLLLFYHTRPDMCIKDIFKVAAPVQHVKAKWKKGMDYMAPISRVCQLKSPIFLSDLQRDSILKTSGFVRGNLRGRPRASEYWPHLHGMIIRRNKTAIKALKKYAA